jgi:hypothetical protein
MLTRAEINAAIKAIDETLALLDDESTQQSLAAVRGSASADGRLFEISQQVAREKMKRAALVDELAAIAAREIAADDEARAAERALHLEQAREHAARLISIASRADKIIADFKAIIGELGVAELATWNSLRAAEASVSDIVVGRRGVVGHATDRMNGMLRGDDRFSNRKLRDVSEFVRIGWAEFVSEGGDDE